MKCLLELLQHEDIASKSTLTWHHSKDMVCYVLVDYIVHIYFFSIVQSEYMFFILVALFNNLNFQFTLPILESLNYLLSYLFF